MISTRIPCIYLLVVLQEMFTSRRSFLRWVHDGNFTHHKSDKETNWDNDKDYHHLLVPTVGSHHLEDVVEITKTAELVCYRCCGKRVGHRGGTAASDVQSTMCREQ